ncbi:MAG: hypothetical protein CL388_02295 [Acidiferrobacteraceae bacterium]|nr:hypothetical protein [Acidiferrobacteraceae bacterium]
MVVGICIQMVGLEVSEDLTYSLAYLALLSLHLVHSNSFSRLYKLHDYRSLVVAGLTTVRLTH